MSSVLYRRGRCWSASRRSTVGGHHKQRRKGTGGASTRRGTAAARRSITTGSSTHTGGSRRRRERATTAARSDAAAAATSEGRGEWTTPNSMASWLPSRRLCRRCRLDWACKVGPREQGVIFIRRQMLSLSSLWRRRRRKRGGARRGGGGTVAGCTPPPRVGHADLRGVNPSIALETYHPPSDEGTGM